MKDLDTLRSCAEYLGYKEKSACLRWLKKHDVKRYWRNRTLLVRKVDVDRVLEKHATGDTVARARARLKAVV